ncbi:S41 family peptidase [Anaeromyxobacter sp. Fw109-5]|uniref:S41 family peptidase n=1 Tax=Anaeromyxobacter sp. (strain Fw109-5) TaxID=404589 RepID=UPI0000ED8A8A|nr:S41 family peptidase [Anaeromyxobacter sp. Fw109-5]ABS27176.1 peptidase S41 [Anaeromyxobacter sp. Fw109-5]
MRTIVRGAPRLRRGLRQLTFALVAAAAACGSSDDASFGPSAQYEARCAAPRAGIDPSTGEPYRDRRGTLADEKAWVRSWIHELYLWYREVPNANPAGYSTPARYFDVLKTPASTASGRPKDRFHFTYPTDAWVALSQSGVEVGYGVQWVILSQDPPRQAVAAYVEPDSPGEIAGIARGTALVAVDGVDLANGTDVDTLNAGIAPSTADEVHTLTIRDGLGTRTVQVTSTAVEGTPVPVVQTISTASGTVGYVLFNDHVATSEAQLVAAIEQLRTAAVRDLVLDLRYNGGGYLAIASQLAYMIAGPASTTGKAFERLVFNDKVDIRDPDTGEPLPPMPFFETTLDFSLPPGAALPTLGLGRVFVLTGAGTCSASESVMNGLRGIGVQVIQIGAATCGKPYGFSPRDNCGTTYFAIQFQGVNEQGFGEYGDGFVPGGSGVAGVPGCAVPDDYGHELGDPAEARLSAALAYRATGRCPAGGTSALTAETALAGEGEVVKSPWRQNRIVER